MPETKSHTLDVRSPNGAVVFTVHTDRRGALRYSITVDGQQVIEESVLGLVTDRYDLTANLTVTEQHRQVIRERYSLPAGKKAVYESHANELFIGLAAGAVDASNGDGKPTDAPGRPGIRVRAADTGVAFRYELDGQESPLTITEERTDFVFPSSCREMWLQKWNDSYEGIYDRLSWQEAEGKDLGMPCLFHGPGDHWTMITEASVYNSDGSYCASHLVGCDENRMLLRFAPEQKEPIRTVTPFVTPWRVVIVTGTLDELINCTMNYDLNPPAPASASDASWIRPGRTVWAWWEFENGGQLYSEQKRYVDFAAAMGFESVTVDAAWDETWMKELCAYARDRGVALWLWTAMRDVDTYEKASERIARWAGWGVSGLKVDFFMNDSQHTMSQYQMIADVMTSHRLMINFHGCTRPGGEGRTYPNLMTAEGVLGLEHYKWSNLPDARHNCTLPFTRNVVGPMDYTVAGFSNRNRNTTIAHQAALTIVFESGAQHFAASIYHLEAWLGTELLRRLRPTYKGLRLLSGYPGDHVVMLRYTDDEWFVGCITNPQRTAHIPLDFLPDGSFFADIYRDDSTGEMLVRERRVVTNRDSLDIQLLASGGAAVYISDGTVALRTGAQLGYMKGRIGEYATRDGYLSDGSEVITYENGDRAAVVSGAVEFPRVAAPQSGRYTVRMTYACAEPCVVEVSTAGVSVRAELEASGGPKIFRTADVVVALGQGDNAVRVSRASGVPTLREIVLMDNAPPAEARYPVTEATVIGDAVIDAPDPSEPRRAMGLGGDNRLLFPAVDAPVDGYYLLTIDYYSGENRPLTITINDRATLSTDLFNTGGWGPPIWNVRGSKEVRVHLDRGTNRIVLHHDMPIAHISAISIRLDRESDRAPAEDRTWLR